MERVEGTVISYDKTKGWGWIGMGTTPETFERLFFHVKQYVTKKGLPEVGQKITFEILPYLDGPRRRALNVEPK
jgi:cold shock CspA family protein